MKFNYILLFLLSMALLSSCKKNDEDPVAPTASFTASKTSVLVNEEVQFVNSSDNATSFKWSFGDGTTSTEVSPKKSYSTTGDFTVTLVATGEGGSNIATKTITVTAPVVKELYNIEYGASLLKKMTLSGSNENATVLDIAGKAGVGLAYDALHNKVYFSDFEVTGSGNIWRMNPDGSELTAIVSNLTDPYGIAVDAAGGKIYWTDDLGNISRANLDGSGQQIGIVNITDGLMRAVALDPENNKMYFYEVNVEVLYSANLDGSNVTPLLTGTYGYAILVDTVNDKIYYDDQNAEKIYRVNLDGTGQVTIDESGSRIYGMAIDYSSNKFYWSGRDSGAITRANLDGSSPEPLASGLSSPRGIALKQ